MRRFFLKFILLGAVLFGLPMAGVILAGLPVERYLAFPPESLYISHAPFSWAAFCLFAAFIGVFVIPLVNRVARVDAVPMKAPRRRAFPWWGWVAAIGGVAAWILAWTRFPWFVPFQEHTFLPLWLSYILVINGLCLRGRGHCMMLGRPGFFLLLFPMSAVFWWFFEYLNRFVQNWWYLDVEHGAWAYFWRATIHFSTVLPAVLGTAEWIQGFPRLNAAFGRFLPIPVFRPKTVSLAVLIAAGAGLGCIGIWPNGLFPLLWVSPLLVVVGLQGLAGDRHIFSGIPEGDWSPVVASALAALFCGGFWEMWNYYSLAKWEYHVPFVQRFELFEMPILGYAGYLPFGLECATVGIVLEGITDKEEDSPQSRGKR